MTQGTQRLSRRTVFAGAGAVGAIAAAAIAARTSEPVQALAQAETLREPPEKGGGYQLSEHVKRYYKTTQV